MKALLKNCLSPSTFERVREVSRPLRFALRPVFAFFSRNDLTRLALLFGTDKAGQHWYTEHYQRYLHSRRKKALNVLEIGVGGYDNGRLGGASLRMWKTYFRNSRIVGIDICDKTQFSQPRIDIRQCDQTDAESLKALSEEYGGFDVIIDDGSHQSAHVIETFQVLFPLLRDGGIYTVEDTQTAYWPTWGGGVGDPKNLMEMFKHLVDGLNHVEYPLPDYEPTYFDKNIVEMAFFHNLIVIVKGKNCEKPNVPELIEREIAYMEANAREVSLV